MNDPTSPNSEARKPRLVHYAKQSALPRFLDEQPNEANSPSMDSLIRDESALRTSKDMKSSQESGSSPRTPLVTSVPHSTPVHARRSLFSGLRGSSHATQPVPTSPAREFTPTSANRQSSSMLESSLSSKVILGASLDDLHADSGNAVPHILSECFEWLRSSGGLDNSLELFRGAGDTNRIADIVGAFELDTFESMDDFNATTEDVCTLVKMFLRSLVEPVGTFALFDEWVAKAPAPAAVYRDLVHQLPSMHEEVLRYVMSFLREVLRHREANGLTPHLLGNALGALLLRPREAVGAEERSAAGLAVQTMLEHYEAVFEERSTLQVSKKKRGGSRRTPRRPTPTPPIDAAALKQPHESSPDEFSKLAKMASNVVVLQEPPPPSSSSRHRPERRAPAPPVVMVAKTPEDSEEDLPESSSDDDDYVVRAPVMARMTIRQRSGTGNGGGEVATKSVPSAQSVFSAVPSPVVAVVRQPSEEAMQSRGDDSLSSIDSQMLRKQIDLLKEMPLTPKGGEHEEEEEETEASRAAKLAEIRQMLVNDPRFRSQTKTPSAKYEPPAANSKPRKKSRRKKRTGTSTTDRKSRGTVDESTSSKDSAPSTTASSKKRRPPKMCGKCKEVVRGLKVNALSQSWHPSCFVCANCGKQLEDFFECNRKPYCAEHIALAEEEAWAVTDGEGQALCGKCKEPVNKGTVVTALGRRWHSGCFVCTQCECVLETYFGAGGKPYCEKHVAAATAVADAPAPPPPLLEPSEAGAARRKKKKKSHRSKRAQSNPEHPPKMCPDCKLEYASRPLVNEHQCMACSGLKCSSCGSWFLSALEPSDAPSHFVCNLCLPAVKQEDDEKRRKKEEKEAAASIAMSPPAQVLSPRRWPKKQDQVTYFEKSKRKPVKRYAVLQEQRFCLYKDENAARKAKDPLEILDLTLLKKVSKMGVHLDKPFCLAFTVDYETYVIWVDQLEYANWSDALVDSGENVAIGAIDQ